MKIRIIAALFIFLFGSLLVSKKLIIPDNIQIKENAYCDVFDLRKIAHLKRYKLKNKYELISHLRENVFYGILLDEEGDPLLYKISISGVKY